MGARQVAVTGIGVVSALGNSLEDFYRSLAEARSGVRRLPDEVTLGSGVQVGALATWDPAAYFKGPEAGSLDRVAQFALTAASQALAASGLDPACAVRHVPMKAERGEIPRAVMSNSFAFGGSNVVLIAERA